MSSTSVPPGTPPPSPPPGGPTGPTPTGPAKGCAEILQDIDSSLIGLLALAYFGPAEQGTSRSVDQACAAEVLLFRLRSARSAVRDLADALNLDLPARQVLPTGPPVGLGSTPSRLSSVGQPDLAWGRSGGAGKPPTTLGGGAGGSAPRSPGATGGEGGSFSLPSPSGPPEFAVGVARFARGRP